MSRLIWRAGLAIAFLATFGAIASAQVDTETAKRRLEERQRAARAAAATQPASTRPVTRPATKPISKAVTQPAAKPTIESILLKLPVDDQPSASLGWDEFSLPKARRLLATSLVGQEHEIGVPFESVEIIRKPAAADPNETDGWSLKLKTRSARIRLFGMPNYCSVATEEHYEGGRRWRGGETAFPVDEDTARRARNWRSGDIVTLAGMVDQVGAEGRTEPDGEKLGIFTVVLRDVRVIGAGPPLPPR